MIRKLLTAVVLAASATAAHGNEAEVLEEAKKREILANADLVQCKRIRPTGSHLKRRVCMKRSDWRRITRESRRLAREIDDLRGLPASPSGPSRL